MEKNSSGTMMNSVLAELQLSLDYGDCLLELVPGISGSFDVSGSLSIPRSDGFGEHSVALLCG